MHGQRGFSPRRCGCVCENPDCADTGIVDNTSKRNFTGSPLPPSHLLLSGSPPLAARAVSARRCAALVLLDVALPARSLPRIRHTGTDTASAGVATASRGGTTGAGCCANKAQGGARPLFVLSSPRFSCARQALPSAAARAQPERSLSATQARPPARARCAHPGFLSRCISRRDATALSAPQRASARLRTSL